MKWRVVLLLMIFIIAVVVYVCCVVRGAPQERRQTSAPVAQVNEPLATDAPNTGASQRRDHAYFIPLTGGKPRPLATMDPFSLVPKTREGLPLDNDPFVAESPQEQRWLDRNGYPNAKQWMAYSAAPDMVLEQAATAGDGIADVMLAARQLAHGDIRASGKLMVAGMNGSSFALSLLAAYLASGKNGNPELGYAVSRVIELRGDWRAGIMRDVMFRVPLSPEQKFRAENKAAQLFNDFKAHSRVQPYVDPRPLSAPEQR